jgi:small conductance mechanosensitive channel
MRNHSRLSLVLALVIAGHLLAVPLAQAAPKKAAADSSVTDESVQLVAELLAPLAAAGRARDSLSRHADRVSGSAQDVLEEQIWQQHLEVQAGLIATASQLEKFRQQGTVSPAAQRMLDQAVEAGWPRYLAQLERRNRRLQAMVEERDAATGTQRLASESQMTAFTERTVIMYQDLVDALLAFERLHVEVQDQRVWVTKQLTVAAGQTGARLTVLDRERALASGRVQRAPEDAAARVEMDVVEMGMKRAVSTFEREISLLARLGQDVTPLKVDLILVTGKVTASAFEPRVIAGLLAHAQRQFFESVSSHLLRWVFQGLLLVGLLLGFRLLANFTRRATRRVVQKAELSQLMRDTIASWSSKLVMMIGIVILLRQLGFQLGPMLAGFGIAGVVIGFALQDTLSNFAAGAMILGYQPFDVGDIIEAGGVMGTVRKMSLVSTTILTLDNQTLIVPNKKVWGDVIRNITAQRNRRVDLMFGVGYEDSVEHVERVLKDIVEADARVLKEPAPLIRLHQLADSSVNFVVRLWTAREHYWDVYWDTTRAVKLAFDREGIKIPFPQRELHVHMESGSAPDVVARPETPPSA